jgi:predicted metal-dependent HD superfamily phosphohydrolase
MYLTSCQLAIRVLVKTYYIEGHRFYHTMDHIEAMLDGYNKYFGEDPSLAEYLAILYHDIVYLPYASGNEDLSAGLLSMHHTIYFPQKPDEVIDQAKEIILATKHDGTPVPGFAERVVDLDMMILGKSEDVYKKYVANTRKEYLMFTDEQWAVGRANVLRRFLGLPRIFITDVMHKQFEAKARSNIQQELEALECLTVTA